MYSADTERLYVLPVAEIKDNFIYGKKLYMTVMLQMLNGKRELNLDNIKKYAKIKKYLDKMNFDFFVGSAVEVLEILEMSEKIRIFKNKHPNVVFENPIDYIEKYTDVEQLINN